MKRVIICGGGVIGASCAYFLSARGADVTVVERTGIACAASGKSGGFLALDWCDGSPLQALARRSFALHAELAERLGNPWGYRRMTTYAGAVDRESANAENISRVLPWIGGAVGIDQRLGTETTTAQVNPAEFTIGLMQAAQSHGATLRLGRVTGIALSTDNTAVRGVHVEGALLEADAVIIAMGPWSILAAQWLPMPAVFGLKGHSLIFEPAAALPADALFLQCADSHGAVHGPEVFPRSNGTVYVCAISSEPPLPLDPAAVAPDAGAIDELHAMCAAISPALASAKVLARQACFRPVTQDGLPLIGPVRGVGGAYIATGHSVWGILNAPATGEALAELLLDGAARSVNLTPFAPSRLRPLDPGRLSLEGGPA